MRSLRRWPWILAVVAMLLTLGFAAAAQRVVRGAFAGEYQQRLDQLGRLVASQIAAEDVADARRLGPEGSGFLNLQAQLDALVATARLENAVVVDSAGWALYDVSDPDASFGLPTAFDSLAAAELAAARRGVTGLAHWRAPDRTERYASVAPILQGPRLEGMLLLVGQPRYEATLLSLRRTLAVAALIASFAIALLAWRLSRAADAALGLERRLARSENLAAMGRLTATLAHEIKNPLAILRGTAKRLGRTGAEAAPLADSMIEEVDRLSRTVNRYLQFARGEPAVEGRGDVAGALAATLDLLEGEFRARDVALERSLAAGAAEVPLDTESLRQVFLNLVLNALEASPAGGRVRATLEREGARVVVRIADTGPGIPAEVLARLGEPFVTTKAQGTGLGLFLAQRLVRASGGTFAAGNAAGGGAEVTLGWRVE